MATHISSVPSFPPVLRVLVVDDNVDGAEALCACLAGMGCDTAVAFNGEQGLAAAAAFRPHLALIDLEMPGISGMEVARRWKAGPQCASAHIVCMTGRGQPDDRRHCLDAGFDDFFTKPMSVERLAELVTEAQASLPWREAQRGMAAALRVRERTDARD